MKKNTVKIIASLLLSCLLYACENKPKEKECCKKEESTEQNANTGESIFNLTSNWTTQNKTSFQLSQLKGKLTIAAMVFTHCESACPRIVADIKRIEKSFTTQELTKIQFLLISMDPERDTAERLLEFSKEHQLNANWTLITAPEDATMEIANVLNVRIKKLSEGGFDHSNTIFLFDQNGNISFQQNGLEQTPTDIINKTKSYLNN